MPVNSDLEAKMPRYVYEVVLPDGEDGQVFEVTQRMEDAPLAVHPTTGQPVRRVPQAAHIGGGWSMGTSRGLLSDQKLARHGYTKYVKGDRGDYEKVAGSGPDILKNPPPGVA
jgi:predicted nucleic acid-binding Zn ribbon protein